MWLKGSLNVFSHLTMHCGRMMALRLMKMDTHNRFQTITVIRGKSGFFLAQLCSRKLKVVLSATYLPTDK
jgi:DNA-binding cell septation regulator SpoVG